MSTKRTPTDCLHCATLSTCILGKLSAPDLETLQPLVHKRSFQKGDVLAQEGEVASTVLIVKVGMAFGYRLGRDMRTRPIGIAGRGAVFGLFGFYGQPNPASTVAVSAGRACEVQVKDLEIRAANDPAFAMQLSASAMQTVGRIASWSEAMRVRGVVNQLSYSLLLLGEAQGSTVVELPTHTALAELLGTTRETLVRALTTLETEGGIRRLERRKCELFQEVLMARLACERAQAAA